MVAEIPLAISCTLTVDSDPSYAKEPTGSAVSEKETVMRAAVCHEFGKPLVVEEIDIDPPQEGEVKVRLAACAICHSDIHLIRGEWGGRPPLVAGHEAAGTVHEVGPNVTLVSPGDHVVVSLLRSCGRCFYCTTGSPHMCAGDYALDRETRLHSKRGEPIQQGIRTAAFAEYTIVEQSQLVPLPEELPLDRAALLACGVITGFGAVVNTAKVRPGESVVVIGTGGVGLNAVQGAALSGAHPIIAIDLLEDKLDAARVFGATHTINAARQSHPERIVRNWTLGRGADYVFVTVGNAAAAAQGFGMLRRKGTEVLVGIPARGATLSLPIAQIVGERTVTGSSMGSTRLSVDVPRLVSLYQDGRLKLDELITARYPLEEINEAIEAVEGGQALRNVIVL
jgi:S-(hydroxymethyl)glutathione dehydrogenase/alcohol dehydrogenase